MAKKSSNKQSERLFEEKLVPAKAGSGELFDVSYDEKPKPVECLGMVFPSDDARRAHFTEKLREKLKDPAFRKIEGFPIGEDEDILALSDPPYYTACPNPFLTEVIASHKKGSEPQKPYHREPFATDVSEGKMDAVYKAHSYHTKVPHKAIMRYILHFTDPGAVVFDGFCGTGMTGIATQLCASPDASFKANLDSYANNNDDTVAWGERLAVLNELSPYASFISHNYTCTVSKEEFKKASSYFFSELSTRLSHLYSTKHTNGAAGRINYVVWSEIFFCQECGKEIVFLQQAMDDDNGTVARSFSCPHCNAVVSKRSMTRAFESFVDRINNRTCSRVKRVPVIINYSVDGVVYEKAPDKADFEILKQVDGEPPSAFFPAVEMPFMHVTHIKDKMSNFGISHFSHFFLPRSQHALAHMWDIARNYPDPQLQQALLFMVEQCNWTMSLFNRYRPTGYSQVNQYMSGVYFIPSTTSEISPWYVLEGKSNRLADVFELLHDESRVFVSTGSGSSLTLPDESVDYIFTDPPFGENLQYSELNWLVECFHRVMTSSKAEAVVNKAQKKDLLEYLDLMLSCFRENFRVLKPGHWMTVEFHNSKNSIWNAIQEAMLRAGFVVADVRMLDKQGETYKQSKQSVVKADLIISAYKPDTALEEQFRLHAGTEDAAWEFARTHLSNLPIFASRAGKVEVIAERQAYLLFDRMVAFHVQRGYSVPLSAAEFYAGLRQRFPERDGMYFLSDQVSEYDRKRLEVKEVEQYELFVSDEKSAIQWVHRQLADAPMSRQDLQPLFMQEAQRVWEKHEQPLELQTILEQSFVENEDGKWRVPDPKNEIHLEQLRHRALMKEFQQYIEAKGKLKVVRTEALRAGFKESWQKKDYTTIVQMAKRVPDAVIQEDQALLMYFDNASLMLGE